MEQSIEPKSKDVRLLIALVVVLVLLVIVAGWKFWGGRSGEVEIVMPQSSGSSEMSEKEKDELIQRFNFETARRISEIPGALTVEEEVNLIDRFNQVASDESNLSPEEEVNLINRFNNSTSN